MSILSSVQQSLGMRKWWQLILVISLLLLFLSSKYILRKSTAHEGPNDFVSTVNEKDIDFYGLPRDCRCTPRCKTTPWDETLTTASYQIRFNRPDATPEKCHFHYRSFNEIFNYLSGKWMFLGGDSHLRGLSISLISMFDDNFHEPYDSVRWFNNPVINNMKLRYLDIVVQRVKENQYKVLFKRSDPNDACPVEEPLPYDLKKLDAFRLTYCMFTFTADMLRRLPFFSEIVVRPNIYYYNVVSWDMVFGAEQNSFDEGIPQSKLPAKILAETNCKEAVCIWASKPAFLPTNGKIDYVILNKLLPTGDWLFLNRTTSSAHMRGDNEKWTNGHTTMLYNHLDHQRLFSYLMDNDPKFQNDSLECDEVLEWAWWCDNNKPNGTKIDRIIENWHHRCDVKLFRTDGSCNVKQLNYIL